MRTVLQIWQQEYRNIFTDRGVLLLFFGAIIIYPIIYPIPYSNNVLKDVPITVVDLNNSQLSRQLIRMIDANEFVDVYSKTGDINAAQKEFFEGEVYGVLLIAKDFSQKILWGEPANVVVFTDASYFLFYRQVLTGIVSSTATMSAGVEIQHMLAQGLSRDEAMQARDPLPLISYPLFNPSGSYAVFVVPAVLLLILQQTLLIGIGMLAGTARERSNLHFLIADRDLDQSHKIILGKAGAYFSLYLVHATYFFGVLFRAYDYPQRTGLLELLVFITPFLFAVIFLGIALSSLFRNRETSLMVLVFTSLPALFLSGFSWPPEAIPPWLHLLSYLLPSTAGIDGFLKLNIMGAEFREVFVSWLWLWGLAGGYFCLAIWGVQRLQARIVPIATDPVAPRSIGGAAP